jgi:hypothetical protein
MISISEGGSPLVCFVGSSPSMLDIARGRHLTGRVGETFAKVYAEPLAVPFMVTTVFDRPIEKRYETIDFRPPKGVREEAALGLRLRREHNRGGTEIGVARARDLSNGTRVSPSTIRRMISYFARHAVDMDAPQNRDRNDPGYPGAGKIAWLLWGGTAGRRWAERIGRQMDAEDEAEKGYKDKLKGVPVVVALGKEAKAALGDQADFVLPHPAAVMKRGDSGEVGRKLKAIKALIERRVARKNLDVEIAKADEEKRVVYGIVLEPETVDLQGDRLSVDTIETAAHDFLVQSRAVGDMHSGLADAEVVESYLAPSDGEMGGQSYSAGTWIMAVKVRSDDLWEMVKSGDYSGFSIGGIGERRRA